MFNQIQIYHTRSAWQSAGFLLCAFVLILFPHISLAQDKIHKTDNSIIDARVLEINNTEIKYKKFSNQNGPAYIVPRKEVSMIVYENGEKEIYNQAASAEQPAAKAAVTNRSVSAGAVSPIDNARSYILNENINEAIASYGKLIKTDVSNPVLLAEDAYALALAGIYDAALMRLDRCRSLGAVSAEINFFTAQVFALMGYTDLANEYWHATDINKAPAWIFSKSAVLLQKYKSKAPVSHTKSREALIANFKHANELASRNEYFQSIALFHDIVTIYPNEYLPFVGYSITLEKTGAFEKSAQTIEKAIALIGTAPDGQASKQLLEKRLASIKQNMTLLPSPYIAPEITTNKKQDVAGPQMMAYAGGMLAPSYASFNGRIGYFISGSSNASFDVGVLKNAEYSSTNLGLSVYSRKNNFVSGAGILMTAGNGNTAFAFKLSVGYSKMSKTRSSSFDIFVDVNRTLAREAYTTACLSIGRSFYFGKRK